MEGRCGVKRWRLFRPEQIRATLPEAVSRWLSVLCELVCGEVSKSLEMHPPSALFSENTENVFIVMVHIEK